MEPPIIIAALYGFWLGIALMGLYTLRALRKELASSEKKVEKEKHDFPPYYEFFCFGFIDGSAYPHTLFRYVASWDAVEVLIKAIKEYSKEVNAGRYNKVVLRYAKDGLHFEIASTADLNGKQQ